MQRRHGGTCMCVRAQLVCAGVRGCRVLVVCALLSPRPVRAACAAATRVAESVLARSRRGGGGAAARWRRVQKPGSGTSALRWCVNGSARCGDFVPKPGFIDDCARWRYLRLAAIDLCVCSSYEPGPTSAGVVSLWTAACVARHGFMRGAVDFIAAPELRMFASTDALLTRYVPGPGTAESDLGRCSELETYWLRHESIFR